MSDKKHIKEGNINCEDNATRCYLNQIIKKFGSSKRLRLLYFMIWVYGEKKAAQDLPSKYLDNVDSLLPNYYEWKKFQKKYMNQHDNMLGSSKLHLLKSNKEKENGRLGRSTYEKLNEKIEILNRYLESLEEAKGQFLQHTKDIDVFAENSYYENMQNQLSLAKTLTNPKKHSTTHARTRMHLKKITILLEPLSFTQKLHHNFHLYQRRFAVLSRNTEKPPALGSLSAPLANEILWLLSERFNYLHDGLVEYAKIQVLLLILVHLLICLPFTLLCCILRYLALLIAAMYFCYLQTQVYQCLRTACKEVNGVTGLLGVYFDVKEIRMRTGLKIVLNNSVKQLTMLDFIVSQGGSFFIEDFIKWDTVFSQ